MTVHFVCQQSRKNVGQCLEFPHTTELSFHFEIGGRPRRDRHQLRPGSRRLKVLPKEKWRKRVAFLVNFWFYIALLFSPHTYTYPLHRISKALPPSCLFVILVSPKWLRGARWFYPVIPCFHHCFIAYAFSFLSIDVCLSRTKETGGFTEFSVECFLFYTILCAVTKLRYDWKTSE